MRRPLASLLLILVVLIMNGCNRPQPTPTPQVITVATDAPVSTVSLLPTPARLVQQLPTSPIPLPTVTPMPQPTATPTKFPYTARNGSSGTADDVIPIPAAALVTCTPQGETIACYDELLDMEFSYPTFMGEIKYTLLRQGGYTGYVYEYMFVDGESDAGGRSPDSSEGRGPMYTDNSGFSDAPLEDLCLFWAAPFCKQLSPSAIHVVMLPQAEWLCSDAMMFTHIPRSLLVLDLPQHPLITGFSFSFPLLSAEGAKAFQEQWYNSERQCNPQTKVELAQYVEQLQLDLEAGTADPEMQQRYDAMLQLAASIRSPFIATNP